jgi:hypothetical protein
MASRRAFLGWASFVGAGAWSLLHHKPGHAHHRPGHGTTTSTTTTTTLPPPGPDAYTDVYGDA